MFLLNSIKLHKHVGLYHLNDTAMFYKFQDVIVDKRSEEVKNLFQDKCVKKRQTSSGRKDSSYS